MGDLKRHWPMALFGVVMGLATFTAACGDDASGSTSPQPDVVDATDWAEIDVPTSQSVYVKVITIEGVRCRLIVGDVYYGASPGIDCEEPGAK